MPPSVPTRPAAAGTVATAWGQWVHDWFAKRDLIRGTAGSQTITNAFVDITGHTMTLGPGWFMIFGVYDIDCSVTGTGVIQVQLVVDGVAQLQHIEFLTGAGVGRASVVGAWFVNIAGAGVIKTQVIKLINAGTAVVIRDKSALIVL